VVEGIGGAGGGGAAAEQAAVALQTGPRAVGAANRQPRFPLETKECSCRKAQSMPVETKAQLGRRYLAVVHAIPQAPAVTLGAEGLVAAEAEADTGAGPWEFENSWWADEGEMAPAANDGRQRFSGKKGEGLTIRQLELMVKGSLKDRFKKLQKDVGNPLEGAEFAGRYCIFLGEFLDNPAKLAHVKGSMRLTAGLQTRWARSWCR
jgi:hypothetical protein